MHSRRPRNRASHSRSCEQNTSCRRRRLQSCPPQAQSKQLQTLCLKTKRKKHEKRKKSHSLCPFDDLRVGWHWLAGVCEDNTPKPRLCTRHVCTDNCVRIPWHVDYCGQIVRGHRRIPAQQAQEEQDPAARSVCPRWNKVYQTANPNRTKLRQADLKPELCPDNLQTAVLSGHFLCSEIISD